MQHTQEQLNSKLYVAIRDNQIDRAKEHLEKGADINNNNGEPIYIATILDNRHEMLQILIDAGADTNIDRHRSIKSAIAAGDAVSLEILFEPKDSFENFHSDFPNALKLATDKDDVSEPSYNVICVLLSRGVDVHYFDDIAVKNSVIANQPEIVDLLLDHGANFHASGDYAFRQAAIKGYDKVLEVAIVKHNLTPTQESLDWMKEKDCLTTVQQLLGKRDLNKRLQQKYQPNPIKKTKGLTMKI